MGKNRNKWRKSTKIEEKMDKKVAKKRAKNGEKNERNSGKPRTIDQKMRKIETNLEKIVEEGKKL